LNAPNEAVVVLPDAIFTKTIQITQVEDSIIKEQREESSILEHWQSKYKIAQDTEGTWRKDKAVVVTNPAKHNRLILENYHDAHIAGHPGIHKTLFAVGTDFWWPSIC
jgi:hypothetical protein